MQELQAGGRQGEIVAALDIGSSKVCCLVAEMQGSGSELSSLVPPRPLGIGYHRSRGIKAGMVFEPAEAEKAIRAAVDSAERQAGVSVDRVHVSLNAGRLRSGSYGAMLELGGGKARRGDVVELQRRGWEQINASHDALIHALSAGYVIDGGPVIDDPVGYSGQKLFADYHAVLADLQPVRRVLGCVEDAYLSPVAVVASPFASALATLRPLEAREGAAVIDLGGGTSSIAVFLHGHMIFIESLSKGGNQISAALARHFSLSQQEAELLKLEVGRSEEGRGAHPLAAELIDQHYAAVLLHLKQRLTDSDFALDACKYVVLTGGGAMYQAAQRLTGELFGRPTRVGSPLHAAQLSAQLASPAFASLWGVLSYVDQLPHELALKFAGEGQASGMASLYRVGRWLRRIGDQLGR